MYVANLYRFIVVCSAFILAGTTGVEAPVAQTTGDLSLNEALTRVLTNNQRLAAFGSEIHAADARRVQAGLRPNPELGFEIEEVRFGDSPSLDRVTRASDNTLVERSTTDVDNAGSGESEFTLGVSQLIELGGKRARRIELADRGKQVSIWDYEIARAEVILDTRRAFLEIVVGQEQVELRRNLLSLAETAAGAVGAQINAGKVTPLLGNRAQVETSRARIEFIAAERELAAARYRLAILWGSDKPDFERVAGDLYTRPAVPNLEDLERRLSNRPDLSRWASEVARREAVIALERTQRIPDLTVSLGWRAATLPDSSTSTFDSLDVLTSTSREEYENGVDHSVVLGFSIPLPLFNRNQGNIREAEALAGKASYERRTTYLGILRSLTTLSNDISALQAEVAELEEQILPTATATFEATQKGFEQGKFPYLDVLDTQRTLFEVRNQYVDALFQLHLAVAEMERFVGESFTIEGGRIEREELRHEQR